MSVETVPLYARIDKNLKDETEDILSKLGISMNNAIQMYFSQIVMTKGIPFNLSLKSNSLRCIDDMSEEEIGHLLDESLDSLKNDRLYSAKEVEEELTRKLGL